MKKFILVFLFLNLFISCKGNKLQEAKVYPNNDFLFLTNYIGNWKIYDYELTKGIGTRNIEKAEQEMKNEIIIKNYNEIIYGTNLISLNQCTAKIDRFSINDDWKEYTFINKYRLNKSEIIKLKISCNDLFFGLYFAKNFIFIGSEGDFFICKRKE